MEKDKKELLEIYRRLDQENKENMLAHLRVALSAQENTKKAMKGPAAPDKPRKSA
jgi:hypothetical protein